MDKIDLSLTILAGVTLIGVIALLFVGKTTDVLLPILTALIGALIGTKKEQVVSFFRKK